jgi:integrase
VRLVRASVWRLNYAPGLAGSHFSKSAFFLKPCFGQEWGKIFETALKDKKSEGKNTDGHKNQFFWWLILISHTGIRLGEAQSLRFKDIIDEEICAYFTSAKTKERRKLNLISLGNIKEMAEEEYNESGVEHKVSIYVSIKNPWFALMRLKLIAENEYKRRDKTITDTLPLYVRYRDWFYNNLESVCERAKVKFLGCHALRHSFASYALLRMGWKIEYLAKWLGHQDISTTYRIYGHLIADPSPQFKYS